jgi:hypothetical protein
LFLCFSLFLFFAYHCNAPNRATADPGNIFAEGRTEHIAYTKKKKKKKKKIKTKKKKIIIQKRHRTMQFEIRTICDKQKKQKIKPEKQRKQHKLQREKKTNKNNCTFCSAESAVVSTSSAGKKEHDSCTTRL